MGSGHIGEGPIAVILKKLVCRVVVGNVEVEVAIMIKVAPGNTLGVSGGSRHAGSRSYVGKYVTAVVTVELIS